MIFLHYYQHCNKLIYVVWNSNLLETAFIHFYEPSMMPYSVFSLLLHRNTWISVMQKEGTHRSYLEICSISDLNTNTSSISFYSANLYEHHCNGCNVWIICEYLRIFCKLQWMISWDASVPTFGSVFLLRSDAHCCSQNVFYTTHSTNSVLLLTYWW